MVCFVILINSFPEIHLNEFEKISMNSIIQPDSMKFGPKIWTHYLLRRFQCDLDALNTQLPLPIDVGEVFRFGISPKPLPRRGIPKYFDRIINLGTNPDGSYTLEPYEDDLRFNLYQRVVQRVPESKQWLLKDLANFFKSGCPDIDLSAAICNRFLNELNLVLADEQTLTTWERVDPDALEIAEQNSLNSLIITALPETLTTLLTLLHLAIWQDAGNRNKSKVVNQLRLSCLQAINEFCDSPVFENVGCDTKIKNGISDALRIAIRNIERHGKRSMSQGPDWLLPQIQNRFVLYKRSDQTEAAECKLQFGSEILSEKYLSELSKIGIEFPDDQQLKQAAIFLKQETIDLSYQLHQRAKKNLMFEAFLKQSTVSPVN
jgi:hypothetical protein